LKKSNLKVKTIKTVSGKIGTVKNGTGNNCIGNKGTNSKVGENDTLSILGLEGLQWGI